MKKTTILIPEYFKRFKCICSNCEDSCCIGWRVTIDKKVYKRYKRNKNTKLKKEFQLKVRRLRNETNDKIYAQIVMDDNGRCSFLDDKNLCIIHRELGEEELSHICKTYPRDTAMVNGVIERSLTPSCPEATRLILLEPSGIEFEYIEVYERDLVPESFIEANNVKSIDNYFWDIRSFSIGLLQNREYELSERIILLGMFYKKVLAGHMDIEKTIRQFEKELKTRELKSSLQNIPTNIDVQMAIVQRLSPENLIDQIYSERYMECVSEMTLGLNISSDLRSEDIKKLYKRGYEEYYSPYVKEKGYIFENYLVNEYYRNLMPLGRFDDIWESYLHLCLVYSIVKLHIIGMGNYKKKIDDEMVVKLIQSFSKAAIHNSGYLSCIIDMIKESGYDSMAYMTVLIKN